jgi:hypothetical protein
VKTGLPARKVFQAAISLCLALFACFAGAADFQLDTTNPYPVADGDCALIEAIENANADGFIHSDCPAGSGADIITLGATIVVDGSTLFPASSPVFFDSGNSGLPEITSDITLRQGELTRAGELGFRFFVVLSGGILRLEDMTLSNGLASGNCGFNNTQDFSGCGGAVVVYQGELHLERVIFENSRALEIEPADISRGGGIWVAVGTLMVSDSRFVHNQADLGGAIAAQFVTATINGSSFEANTAAMSGGAIYHSYSGGMVISDSTFYANEVEDSGASFNGGGAIDNAGSSSQLTLINSHFIGNSAPRGGALNNYNASKAQIINSTFRNNSATIGGGAIRNEGSGATVNIHASTVTANTALQAAGIMNGGTQTGIANIFDSTITENIATFDGGGVLSTGTLAMVNSRVSGNSAGKGGGVSMGSAGNQVVTVDSSTFLGNVASSSGGGLHFTQNPSSFPNTLTISDSTFDANQAGEGGGLYADVVDMTVTGSTFSNNVASSAGIGGGGGIHLRSSITTGSVVDINNTTLSANHAAQDGGGIYLSGSTLSAVISSTTIATNTASSSSGGDGLHFLVTPASVTVKDSILADNGDRNCLLLDGFGFTDGGTNMSTDESCKFDDTAPGTGNEIDPLLSELADNGGPTQTHALGTASPAIDAGSGGCQPADQRGAVRVKDCDIGAFEAGVPAPIVTVSLDRETLLEEEETVATISITVDNTAGNAQAVDVDVPIRVTGSASGLGVDYKLSQQDGLDETLPGRVKPLSFVLGAGENQTQEIELVVINDLDFEAPETVVIEFAVSGFAQIEKGSVLSLTIISDDANPRADLLFEDSYEAIP